MFFNADEARAQFNIPETLVPVAVLPLGYPADDSTPAGFHTQRKALDELVKYGQF
jgi:nitroreductase